MQRTFYYYPDEAPPEGVDAAPAEDAHTIKWGYNLADVERLARGAANSSSSSSPRTVRYTAAYDGIVDALYASQTRPDPRDLVNARCWAILNHTREEMRHHGRRSRHPEQRGPRYVAFWGAVCAAAPSPEPRIVENTALWQIWQQLTPSQREALLALATHGSSRKAADALVKNHGTFNALVLQARRRFFALWHEGETPSRLWSSGRYITLPGEQRPGERHNLRRVVKRRVAA